MKALIKAQKEMPLGANHSRWRSDDHIAHPEVSWKGFSSESSGGGIVSAYQQRLSKLWERVKEVFYRGRQRLSSLRLTASTDSRRVTNVDVAFPRRTRLFRIPSNSDIDFPRAYGGDQRSNTL